MYRKYIEGLKKWYKNENRRPLAISGPRFSGKTYLVKTLLGDSILNKQYIYIDCDRDITFLKLINKGIKVEELLSYLSINYNNIKLLIFDNVDENKTIISVIEKLHEYLQTMPIVMIQTSKKYYSSKDTTYMNSFDKMTIYPLDFEEYLLVRDKYLYINIKNHFENGKRINKNIKEDIFEIFKEYLVIGGLPEVVVTYIETKNYGITKDVIQKLSQQLINGFGRNYLNVTSAYNAVEVFQNIYGSLNQSFFKAASFEGTLRIRDMNIPLNGLIDNKIVSLVSKIDNIANISSNNTHNKHFRVYMYDLGILNYQNDEIFFKKSMEEAKKAIKSALLENYIVNELCKYFENIKYVKLKNKKDLVFLCTKDEAYFALSYSNTRSFFSTLSLLNKDNIIINAIKLYDKIPSKKIRSDNEIINDIKLKEMPIFALSFVLN